MLKGRVNFVILTLLREKDKISVYTMSKLPPSLPHFNHGTIIRTGV